ncbi:hypothetical protein LSAT2_024414 [Lamellibrachia satsuma]|nr:hypothetical protein LSAT2_024414 [Lamellibrachia satsuma]
MQLLTVTFILAARSRLTDESFDMCQFMDDPQPLGGRIRSSQFKQLLPSAGFAYNNCGLRGTAGVNVTFSSALTCAGTLSDISATDCSVQSKLRLQLPDCDRTFSHKLLCAGYFNDRQTGEAILVTRSARLGTRTYICWMVRKSPTMPVTRSHTYELQRIKCGAVGRGSQSTSNIAHILLEPVESRCVMDDRSASSDKTSVIFSRLSLQPPSFPRQSSMATNKNLAVHVTPHSTGNAANATDSTIMRDRGMRDHIRFDIGIDVVKTTCNQIGIDVVKTTCNQIGIDVVKTTCNQIGIDEFKDAMT